MLYAPTIFDRRFGRVIDALNDLAELSPKVPIALFFRACLTYPRIEWKRRSQSRLTRPSTPEAPTALLSPPPLLLLPGGAIQFPGGPFIPLWTSAFHGAL